MKKEKNTEDYIKHPEIKGLIILSSCLTLLIALISFVQGEPTKNLLGLVGYWMAMGSLWVFGLGAYLIALYATWVGWRLLYSETVPAFSIRTFYFSILLISVSLLLTIYSESYGLTNPLLQTHTFSETLTLKKPFLHKIIRYNIGGVPLYYLYKDLPLYNIMNLLSPVGATLTFAITAFISFVLLTGVSIVGALKNIKKLYLGIRAFFRRVLKGFKPFPTSSPKETPLSYQTMEDALSKPSLTTHPIWPSSSPSSST